MGERGPRAVGGGRLLGRLRHRLRLRRLAERDQERRGQPGARLSNLMTLTGVVSSTVLLGESFGLNKLLGGGVILLA